MNRQTTKLDRKEMVEIFSALRMSAERYDQHAKAAIRREAMDSAEEWTTNAEFTLSLYQKLVNVDEIVVCTFTE